MVRWRLTLTFQSRRALSLLKKKRTKYATPSRSSALCSPKSFTRTPEQSEFINERLEYLSKAVDRLNRFYWNGVAISVVMSIAVNLSVDTERGRVLFNTFKAAFRATT